MGLLKHSDTYLRFAGQCTQCKHCTPACESLIAADMTLGGIACAMLDAERGAATKADVCANIIANPQLIQAVRGCFFCTSCKNTCFAHNDVCDLIYHARVDFLDLGLIPRDSYSSVLVDQEWDIFTAYRAIHGIGYPDLTRHIATEDHEAEGDCAVAFFPGCSLAAYGPELTREVFQTVEALGGKTTMIDHCCGSPLKSAGFFDRAEALCDRIADEIVASDAKTLVCVCPGCANAMNRTLEKREVSIEVKSLSSFLLDNGFEPKRPLPEADICMSKACQDRDGSYLQDTCNVLGIGQDATFIFEGCCGAGGAVNSFQPERCDQQTNAKLAFAPDGSTVVTMCPTCTYTYALRQYLEPRNIENKHYCELLFENQFDWNLVFHQLGSMWTGEYGQWLAQVFA